MKTFILPAEQIEEYHNTVLSCDDGDINRAKILSAVLGLEELDVEEAKKKAKIGDCLLFKYDNKLVPFQVIHKYPEKGTCVIQSYYLLEKRAFDQKTNVWKDAEIRQYLNGEFTKKFDKEFVDLVKPHKVHTDNYVTEDKFWLLSHEEIGYKDTSGMFRPNSGAETFDYYKENT